MSQQAGPSLRALRGASAGPFPVITLIVVIAIGLASFLTASYLQIFDDGSGEPFTTGPSAFSRSAIGHRALAETLRRLGYPVEISRFDSLAKAGPNSLLLVIEPDIDGPGKRLLAHLRDVPHAFLVLPKWAGRTDRQKPIWIDRMKLRSPEESQQVLRILVPDGEVFRAGGFNQPDDMHFPGKISLDPPQYFNARSEPVVSRLSTEDGMLLGSMQSGGNQLWILSDPDLLSNSGIDDADNGVVAISIIESLLPKGGTIIIDETAHGFEQRPNLMRILLHPPFVIVLIGGAVALVLLIWAGAVRFGVAESETAQLAAGKFTLVRNAAQLLRLGTSAATLLQNYRRLSVASVYAELHGRAGLDESAQAAWLDRAAVRRGLEPRLEKLLNRIAALAEADRLDAGKALGFALELHRWKQEILNGTVVPRTG